MYRVSLRQIIDGGYDVVTFCLAILLLIRNTRLSLVPFFKSMRENPVIETSCSLLQFFYYYDVPYVRRNNRKIARLQYEAFCLSIQNEGFYEFVKV